MPNSETDALLVAQTAARRMMADDAASASLGISIHDVEPGKAKARMQVTSEKVNGHNICHGGLIFALADTAFAFACNSYGHTTVAAAASIDFRRPATLGDELLATAIEIERSKRTGIYDVVVENASGQRVALFRGRSARLSESGEARLQSDT